MVKWFVKLFIKKSLMILFDRNGDGTISDEEAMNYVAQKIYPLVHSVKEKINKM